MSPRSIIRSRGNFRTHDYTSYVIIARSRDMYSRLSSSPGPTAVSPRVRIRAHRSQLPERNLAYRRRLRSGRLTRIYWPASPRPRESSACYRCPATPEWSSTPACDNSPCFIRVRACCDSVGAVRRRFRWPPQKCNERAHATRNKYVCRFSRERENTRERPRTPEHGRARLKSMAHTKT